MLSKQHVLVAGLAGLLVCFTAGAQTHGSAPSLRMPPVQVRSAGRPSAMSPGAASSSTSRMIRPSRAAGGAFVSPNGRVTSGFAPTGDFAGFESDDVPGLGFDYVHLAAISGALHNGSSFRFGHHEHNGGGSFVPIWFGGYPFYYDETGYDAAGYEQSAQQAQPQPQIIVIQQPVPAQSAADTGSEAVTPTPAASAPQASDPVRDVGEFILVRRDGRILFASLFSVVGEQLQYVTPEGMRRTVPVADLDADATEQMNEARGTSVQIRN